MLLVAWLTDCIDVLLTVLFFFFLTIRELDHKIRVNIHVMNFNCHIFLHNGVVRARCWFLGSFVSSPENISKLFCFSRVYLVVCFYLERRMARCIFIHKWHVSCLNIEPFLLFQSQIIPFDLERETKESIPSLLTQ